MAKTNKKLVIKSRKQYKRIMIEIDKLMRKQPSPKSKNGKRLNKLVDAVVIYEKKEFKL
jgi:antitoxin component HigA of HigAB toxin-antitoxin module